MGTGGALYLAMAVIATSAFAFVLAYYSWQQSRIDRERAAQAAARQPVQATAERARAMQHA